jgi:xanthine dehydrogenase small subunit
MALRSGYSDSFTFRLNGEMVCVRGVQPHTTLLDYLRDRGLTGAKEGCAEGECGACTVVMVKEQTSGAGYTAVNSCLVFLPAVAGQEIYTVEALAAHGQCHPVQRALAASGSSQCGYCTPGFVMSLFAEQYRPDRNGPCDIQALSGNLCRCTGYRPIRDAAWSLGPAPEDSFRRRLSQPTPQIEPLFYRYNGSRFSRPATLAECVLLLSEEAGARLVAGATDLAVESNLRGRRFPHLVSVEAIAELRVFRETPEAVEIGAGLTLEEIRERWTTAPPVLDEWLALFASPLIRNRATLGGNLATASPIGDSSPLLLALDASVTIAGASGSRTVALEQFFSAYRQTVLAPTDVLVAIRIPKPLPQRIRFYKAAKRRLDDISTVAACFALDLGRAGRIERARFAYGGVAAIPKRVVEGEQRVLGRAWDRSSLDRAQDAIGRDLTPLSDHRGSAAYRLALSQSLLEKFWEEAA